MRRVLFVDDESRILEGLERMLRIRDPGWEMVFTTNPLEALEHIHAGDIDVIVTDMRMPEMSGVQLLTEAHTHQPKTVRIVLSGYAEEAAVVASLSMTHQFLSKPIGADELIAVVDRACELQDMLDSDDLCQVVGQVGSLPLRPTIYAALSEELARPAISTAAIAGLIEQDIAITAKLLQVVNSAFVGRRPKTISVKQAVAMVGIDMLKSLLLSLETFESMSDAWHHIDLDDEYDHAVLTAELARQLCEEPDRADDAFVAAMLHDIGKLVMVTEMTDDYAALTAESKSSGRELHALEYERYGVCHAEIGAYLLGAWGMPYDVVDAVARHHRPRASRTGALDVAGSVYVASRLATQVLEATPGSSLELDPTWLESVGGAGRIDQWRQLAAELDRQGSS